MKLPKGYSEELIDQYLSGELEEADLAKLEAEIALNSELKAYIDLQKHLLSGIEHYGEQQLKKQIRRESQQLEAEGFFVNEDKIDDYLLGRLSTSEVTSLEQLAATQPQLQNKINKQKELLWGIEALGQQQLLDKIRAVESHLKEEGFFDAVGKKKDTELHKLIAISQEVNSTKNNSQKLLYRWSTIAAVVAISFLALRFLIWPMFSSGTGKELPLLALEEQLSVVITDDLSEQGFAGDADQELRGLQKGLEFYKSSNYTEAIPHLKQYIKNRPMAEHVSEVQLYLAISYLANHQAKESLPILLGLEQNPPSSPQQVLAIDWYLAKAYWDLGEKVKAKTILMQLSTKKSPYQKNAQNVLE
jgi:TolA-binding protein